MGARLNPCSLHSRFGDAPDGRRQIGSTPAGGDAGSTGRLANHGSYRPFYCPDEALYRRPENTRLSVGGDQRDPGDSRVVVIRLAMPTEQSLARAHGAEMLRVHGKQITPASQSFRDAPPQAPRTHAVVATGSWRQRG